MKAKAAPRKSAARPSHAEAVAEARESFLARAEAFAKEAGIKLSTLSLYLMKDGKGLDRIKAGGDIGTRQLERAELELARRIQAFRMIPAAGDERKKTRR